MAKDIKLVAQTRKTQGTAQARRLRREGWLPGVINNSKGDSRKVQMNMHDFKMMLRKQRSDNVLFDVELDGGTPVKVLLKEVQYDSLTSGLVHADFMEVSMTEKMKVRIPVVIAGEAPGVQAGGILEQILRDVEVECLPGDMIEMFTIDVSGLQLGQALKVSDLKADPKLAILTDKNAAVVIVSVPRAEEEVVAEEAAATAEPEVIGRKKDDEEGEAAAGEEEGKGDKKGEKKEGAPAGAKGAAPAAGKGAAPAAGKGGAAPAAGKGAAPAGAKGAAPAPGGKADKKPAK
ncbi:MAG: 50S ribosomal protein L25 [Verrucomicrobia bacterium]|nr:50S ribosomal protein L25 [Verrucomicrobiota bacterium]